MSIEVSCTWCRWSGTVDDSLAGEVIACRSCAASIAVPREKAEDGPEYELVDGAPPKVALPDELKKDPVRAAKAKRKSDILKQYAVRPEARRWRIPPKVVRLIGLLIALAGLVTLGIDTILTQWSVYPFILFGVGTLVATIAHVLVSTTT